MLSTVQNWLNKFHAARWNKDVTKSQGLADFNGNAGFRITKDWGTLGATIPSVVKSFETMFKRRKSFSSGLGPEGVSDSKNEKALLKSEADALMSFSMWLGIIRLIGHWAIRSAQSNTRSGSRSIISFCNMGATNSPPCRALKLFVSSVVQDQGYRPPEIGTLPCPNSLTSGLTLGIAANASDTLLVAMPEG